MIGSVPWNIVWDKKDGGGSFNYGSRKIIIGLKDNSNVQLLEIIIHELKEIIQIEQATRYNRIDADNNYEFHYSHKEHTDLCARLSGLLNEFIV